MEHKHRAKQQDRADAQPGTYRRVRVDSCTAATLLGTLVPAP